MILAGTWLVSLLSTPGFAAYPPRVVVDLPDGDCIVGDTHAGSISVSVASYASSLTPEALGAYFRIGSGGGFTGVLVGERWGATFHLGNVTDGAIVAYEQCQPGRFEIVRLTYQVYGTSPPCSYLEVLPHPDYSSVIALTCAGGAVETKPWGPLWVNYAPQCGAAWCVLATESSSWGKIKALYR